MEKFIMYNKTKSVMGNNSDIKIRVRWDPYEKCRFENVNDDEGDESRCGAVMVQQSPHHIPVKQQKNPGQRSDLSSHVPPNIGQCF